MYNSWDTLKKEGSVTVELKQNVKSVSKLLPGHYNLENIAKVMNTMFRRYGYRGLETEINQPLGQLVIKNLVLVLVFGIERKLAIMTFVKKLTAPTTYFIHCDLIDTEQNLFNGKRKDLLAVFDVKGKPSLSVSKMNTASFLISKACHLLAVFDVKGKPSLSVSKMNTASFLISKACQWYLN